MIEHCRDTDHTHRCGFAFWIWVRDYTNLSLMGWDRKELILLISIFSVSGSRCGSWYNNKIMTYFLLS